MTTEMIVAVSAMAVAVIGALAGAVVTIMKAFAEMRIQMSRIEGTASDIHAATLAQSAPGTGASGTVVNVTSVAPANPASEVKSEVKQ